MFWGFCLSLLMVVVPKGSPAQPPLTVSAATSLTDVLADIAAAYGNSGGGHLRFNFAASNVLARQIVNGAPVDVFVSADAAQMDLVARAQLIVPQSRVDLVGNRLAVVAAPERVEYVKEAFPGAAPGIRRLAIGDPAAVPAGVYARAYLERRGLWVAYAGRIVPTANVRAALAAVQNGSVDAAIVYVTDVWTTRGAAAALVIAGEDAPAIVYPAAALVSTRQRPEAMRFLAFLQSADAREIFVRHGFVPLPSR
jgi:molybdate transport system substrate-binding protein